MTEANSTRAPQRAASVRTALILTGVALAFFSGIIVAQRFGASAMWLGTLGIAVIGFPLAVLAARGRAR
jgi:hypothetical protein